MSENGGAGKTQILSELENLLRNKALIIRFKPWNSKSPEHLINDFFSELRKGIDKSDSNIGATITRLRHISLISMLTRA